MPLVRVHRQSAPDVSSSDWSVEVVGTYACEGTQKDYDLSATPLGSGRWVIIKADAVTGWAGATATPPAGKVFMGASNEPVRFPDGTTKQCIVVTLA